MKKLVLQRKLKDSQSMPRLLFFALAAALTVWLLSLPLANFVSGYFKNVYVRQETGKFETAMDAETKKYDTEARELARMETLQAYIKQKNALDVISLFSRERDRTGMPLFTATDADGMVLSRLNSVSKRGDRLFQTTAYGRALAQGRGFVSFEASGVVDTAMVIVAGQPVPGEGGTVGSVLAGRYLDSAYTKELKGRYGLRYDELVFYKNGLGVTGSSFDNENIKGLLPLYIGDGSDWVRNGKTGVLVEMDGTRYLVENIQLPGLEGPAGGLLLFLPVRITLPSFVFGLFIVVFFLLFTYILHRRLWPRHDVWYHWPTMLAVSVVLLGAVVGGEMYRLNRQVLPISKPVYKIYNSTMRFEPDSGLFDAAFSQKVAIIIETGGEVINTVGAVVAYDPASAEVVDIVTNNSLCRQEFFVEKDIDNKLGVVRVACAIPGGFRGEKGTLAELVIKPLKQGEMVLRFDPETQVLANDGLGTNVLRQAPGAGYTIVSNTSGKISAPVVFSDSHPNSEKWYSNREVRIFWDNAQHGYAWRYSFDSNPTGLPFLSVATEKNGYSTRVDRDGTYYFHLQGVKGGVALPTSTTKVKIDATPPTSPVIKMSSNTVARGEVLRVEFSSQDVQSGLQKNYYVKVDNNLFLPATSPLYMPLSSRGRHSITVRAFDNAGNYSDASAFVEVTR